MMRLKGETDNEKRVWMWKSILMFLFKCFFALVECTKQCTKSSTINNNFVSLLLDELEKREGAHGALFCTFDNCKMFFNLLLARKNFLGFLLIVKNNAENSPEISRLSSTNSSCDFASHGPYFCRLSRLGWVSEAAWMLISKANWFLFLLLLLLLLLLFRRKECLKNISGNLRMFRCADRMALYYMIQGFQYTGRKLEVPCLCVQSFTPVLRPSPLAVSVLVNRLFA